MRDNRPIDVQRERHCVPSLIKNLLVCRVHAVVCLATMSTASHDEPCARGEVSVTVKSDLHRSFFSFAGLFAAGVRQEIEAVLRQGHTNKQGELCIQAVFTLLDLLKQWVESNKAPSGSLTGKLPAYARAHTFTLIVMTLRFSPPCVYN